MGVHAEAERVTAGERDVCESLPPPRRTNLSGDLSDLLDRRPFFRTRHRGYDRLEVDNYAAWAEAELSSVRRQSSHLLARYGACAAELERLRRESARPHRDPDLSPVTRRLGEMLRLAAEEAATIRAAGVDEAERIVAEARSEAEARLQKVELIREAAVAAGEEVLRERDEATGILARARARSAEILREAAIERDRLAAEAAERLAAVQAEVDDLRRQRDEARESLNRLTARIGEALQAATDAPAAPGDLAVLADHRPSLASSAS
jgi:cell division septum initiation protein DivIVA